MPDEQSQRAGGNGGWTHRVVPTIKRSCGWMSIEISIWCNRPLRRLLERGAEVEMNQAPTE
eukprot:COSAG04_NODE_380_length_15462_cov_2.388401_16_plen_61_part_00